jgi:isochorismate synthase
MSNSYEILTATNIDKNAVFEFLGHPQYFFKSLDCEISGAGIYETYALNLNNSKSISRFIAKYRDHKTDLFPAPGPVGFCVFEFESNSGSLIIPRRIVVKFPDNNGFFLSFGHLNTTPQMEEGKEHVFRSRYLEDDFQFENKIKIALDLIDQKELKKVVLSRGIDIQFKSRVNKIAILERLISLNPQKYIYMIENFLGASPELLIGLKNGRFFSNPLAGTSSVNTDKSLLYSKKNLLEHEILVDYVKEILSKYSKDLNVSELKEFIVQDLVHLSTELYGTLNDDLNIFDLVSVLHPTPAILGLPIDKAYEFVKKYETTKRSFFSAPVGIVDANGNGQFAIAIRALLFNGYRARIWAGAGIVEGSDPKDEINEINAKINSVLRALETGVT